MVAWYRQDIPTWMDNTEDLPDGAYRALHVICQLIYLNEGPIRYNEKGIAGRCNQHVLAFRKNIKILATSGLLTLNPDGTLDEPRANLELARIGRNRVHAGLGGSSRPKSLENHSQPQAMLENLSAHKTRKEESREEKKDGANAPINLFPLPTDRPSEEKSYFDRFKEICGPKSGGLAVKLKNHMLAKGKPLSAARAAVETASSTSDPKEY